MENLAWNHGAKKSFISNQTIISHTGKIKLGILVQKKEKQFHFQPKVTAIIQLLRLN